ncbi:lipoprotein insertase outer membrane protein LolB [Azotobacter sp. CWF10]
MPIPEAGRLEGLAGGPRDGEDAQQLLLEATGWDIPVNQLPEWIRGLVARRRRRPRDGRTRR